MSSTETIETDVGSENDDSDSKEQNEEIFDKISDEEILKLINYESIDAVINKLLSKESKNAEEFYPDEKYRPLYSAVWKSVLVDIVHKKGANAANIIFRIAKSITERNLQLGIKVAQEILKDENLKPYLKDWVCGMDVLGKYDADSLTEENNETHLNFIKNRLAKKENITNKIIIQKFKTEDSHFIKFLIKYNLLKEVVYDRLHEILPKLLKAENTSYTAWHTDFKLIDYIDKVMKELGYKKFESKRKEKNICQKEKDLLIWCIFSGRYKLVKILLRTSQFDVISLGVFCRNLIIKLSDNSMLSSESINFMKQSAMMCQQIAIDTLQATFLQCLDNDDRYAISDYLEFNNPSFNGHSWFDMAIKGRCSQVLALTSSKNIISSRWYKTFDPTRVPNYKRYTVFIFFLAVCSFEWLLPINIIFWLVSYCMLKRKKLKHNPKFPSNENFVKFVWAIIQTPFIKFVRFVIQHVTFLVIFANVVLSNLDANLSYYEIACCIYVLAYGIEEVKQFIQGCRNNLSYFSNEWNYFDISALLTFAVGFGCRWFLPNENLHIVSRFFYVVSMQSFFIRLLFMCTLSDKMGSTLIIIREILRKDVFPFLFILLLFIIPYGVAAQAMMLINDYGNGTMYNATAKEVFSNIVSFSFFAMLGDFQRDKLDDQEKVGSMIAIYFFLIIYALCTNVVLLNLLVSIFSKTAAAIDDNEIRDRVTLLDRMEIVEEFENKSALTLPFNVIQIIIEIFVFCNLCNNKVADESKKINDVEWKFNILQAAALHDKRKKIGHSSDITKKMAKLNKKFENFETRINKEKSNLS